MATLLHIDSSPLGVNSVSRRLTAEFERDWRSAHAAGTVITRDVADGSLSTIDAAWIGAAFTPETSRTAAQRATLAQSDRFLAELYAADEYLLGVPMHNFSVPSALKLWMDQIARVGETFRYGDDGPVGLLRGKKATVVTSSGGKYGPNEAASAMNFLDPYLQAFFAFIGVTDITFIRADGASVLHAPNADREAFLAPHVNEIHASFAGHGA